MKRSDGRADEQLREVQFDVGFAPNAEGSVLISMGNTRVLCTASVEEGTPRWMQSEEKDGGWITAEYAMLPRSTGSRVRRERNGISGRSQEIQRLIGRSLRAAVNLELIGPRTITIDCDVIQADGGTRTASITGGYIALMLALGPELKSAAIPRSAIRQPVAAISAGVVQGRPVLDLCYEEDVAAEVDANFVCNGAGEIVEVQGTAEGETMTKADFDKLFAYAATGIEQLIEMQHSVLKREGISLS
ncbi:MAG: ribonuclease PH [Bdellovibrionales bacterium]|nr:ribonuclease PH [Bdellovibrionales bacterium]